MSVRRLATLISAVAAVSRTSETYGTGSLAAPPRDRGNARGTRTASATPPSASAPNAQRHASNWANAPPRAGPASVPTPHIADTRAVARTQSRSG